MRAGLRQDLECHTTVDFTETFKEKIIIISSEDYLTEQHSPIRNVRCNRKIKWGEMLREANSLGNDMSPPKTMPAPWLMNRAADVG
ncbi:MAG: hypothetical protein IPP80_13895 [Ignavibacteria bacterium]|nr:hypothetical protein [Ignavibacteria bacterium]